MKNKLFKKVNIFVLLLLLISGVGACKYDDDALWNKINSLDDRVTALEDRLTQMNGDISAISTIINAVQNRTYVVSVTETEDGYGIEFSNGEKITIRNGKDGADGKDAPVISVGEFEGEYYWVLVIDGVRTWLTDEEGNKLPVTGEDGITPILKVSSEGYWLISYDRGITFELLLDEKGNPVKAVGSEEDSFFSDVSVEGDELVLTLADGTVLRIAINQVEGVSSPVNETSDNYDITYQYNEGVIVLSDRTQAYLEKVEEDSILYFSATTPANILPDVGDIISAKVTEKTPYGLGNRVISKTEEEGMIRCVTSVAPLDDIFKVLELTSSFPLTDLMGKNGGFYDEEGNYYEYTVENVDDVMANTETYWAQMPSRAQIGSREVLVIPINKATKNGPYAQASLVLGGIFTYNQSKENTTFECSLEPWIGIKGELGVTGEWVDGYVDLIKEIPVIRGSMQVGVVNLRPSLKFSSILAVEGSGSMSVDFGQYFGFKCGWTERGWFQQNTSPQFTLDKFFDGFAISGKVAIGPKAIFDLGCGVYTEDVSVSISAEPSLMLGAELGISGKIENNRWQIQGQSATLDVTVDFSGKIKAKLFNITIYESEKELVKWNLLNLSTPIFPQLENGSLSVTCTNESPLVFDTQYTVTGGVLAKLLGGMPSMRVDRNGTEVYHIIDDQELQWTASTTLYHQLTDLEKNVNYTAVPCIYIDDACYEWEGIDFESEEEEAGIVGQWGITFGIGLDKGLFAILTFKEDGTYSYECNPTKTIFYWTDSIGESHSRLRYAYCSGSYVFNKSQATLSLKVDHVTDIEIRDGIEYEGNSVLVSNLFGRSGSYRAWTYFSSEKLLIDHEGWPNDISGTEFSRINNSQARNHVTSCGTYKTGKQNYQASF